MRNCFFDFQAEDISEKFYSQIRSLHVFEEHNSTFLHMVKGLQDFLLKSRDTLESFGVSVKNANLIAGSLKNCTNLKQVKLWSSTSVLFKQCNIANIFSEISQIHNLWIPLQVERFSFKTLFLKLPHIKYLGFYDESSEFLSNQLFEELQTNKTLSTLNLSKMYCFPVSIPVIEFSLSLNHTLCEIILQNPKVSSTTQKFQHILNSNVPRMVQINQGNFSRKKRWKLFCPVSP